MLEYVAVINSATNTNESVPGLLFVCPPHHIRHLSVGDSEDSEDSEDNEDNVKIMKIVKIVKIHVMKIMTIVKIMKIVKKRHI